MDIYECVYDEAETHTLSEPIALSCGHCICKGCIREMNPIYCKRCRLENTNDLTKSNVSLGMVELLKLNADMLFKSQRAALEAKLKSLRVSF